MRGFFGRLGERFRNFMTGRYGGDELGRFTLLLAVIFMIIEMITKLMPFYYIEMILRFSYRSYRQSRQMLL